MPVEHVRANPVLATATARGGHVDAKVKTRPWRPAAKARSADCCRIMMLKPLMCSQPAVLKEPANSNLGDLKFGPIPPV